MRIALALLVAAAVAGCTNIPAARAVPASACDVNRASYECQVEQYENVGVQ